MPPTTYVAGAAGAPQGVSGGGPLPAAAAATPQLGAAPPPTGDLATALAQLTGALQQLSGVLATMSGAAAVQGGGPTGGCGCGGGGGTGAMGAPTAQGANAGPTASPAASTESFQSAPAAPAPTSATPAPDAGGSVRDRIVQIARDELKKGVKEDAGEDRDKAGNIVKYRGAVTSAGEDPDAAEPWCADFASWVLKQAGVPFGKDGKGEDYTVAMIDWAKGQNRYHERGGYEPKPGDLVMFDWGGGQDVDHVAIVEKVENGRVHTIGGNESDSLRSQSYPIGDKRMMGYITPS
jgi:cell wall-associated NlpC family hydrolase